MKKAVKWWEYIYGIPAILFLFVFSLMLKAVRKLFFSDFKPK
ncbi:MAG TPA: hypothetical protein PKD79_02660 [Candidatus Doudnabacteria bacterium]|nr:hypothetical protein [Candidatus Doudnabacteria bacterium]